MLTSGAIEALELLGKALVDKGDRVPWRRRRTSAPSGVPELRG